MHAVFVVPGRRAAGLGSALSRGCVRMVSTGVRSSHSRPAGARLDSARLGAVRCGAELRLAGPDRCRLSDAPLGRWRGGGGVTRGGKVAARGEGRIGGRESSTYELVMTAVKLWVMG